MKNDGGPAFPIGQPRFFDGKRGMLQEQSTLYGISIRDYFAGIALQGFLASPVANANGQIKIRVNNETLSLSYESAAYAVADAMLLERNKNDKESP